MEQAAQNDISGVAMDHAIAPSKLRNVKWLLLASVVVALASWSYQQFAAPITMSYAYSDLSISVIQEKAFENKTTVTALSHPKNIRHMNTLASGRVKTISAKNGDLVEQGQLVFTLESFDHEMTVMDKRNTLQTKIGNLQTKRIELENQLMDRQSKMANAKYELKNLEQEVERLSKSHSTGDVSTAKLEQTKARFELKKELYERSVKQQKNYEASYQVRLAQFSRSQENNKRELAIIERLADVLNVRATFSGRLSGLSVEIGENIAKGAKVAELHSPNEVLLTASISENYINKIKEGMLASVRYETNDYPMTIGRIDPDINKGSFTIDLHFTGELPIGLGSGRTLNASIFLSESQNSLVLNSGQYMRETSGRWVFVLSKDGQYAQKRPVKLGRNNYRYVEVVNGLEAGERVIVSSYSSFIDMERLKLNH